MILKSIKIDINHSDLCNEIKLIFIRDMRLSLYLYERLIKTLPNGDDYKIVHYLHSFFGFK